MITFPIHQHPLWYRGLLSVAEQMLLGRSYGAYTLILIYELHYNSEQHGYYIYLANLHSAQYTGAFWARVQVLYLPQMEMIDCETLHMSGDTMGACTHQI